MSEKYSSLLGELELVWPLWQRLQATKDGHGFSKPDFSTFISAVPSEEDPYADVSEIIRREGGYRRQLKDLEKKICDVRMKLLTSPAAVKWPEFAEVRRQQLRHREEDRRLWLNWLAEKEKIVRWLLENPEGADYKNLSGLADRIGAEKNRIAALREEDLLNDSIVFARNENEFLPEER